MILVLFDLGGTLINDPFADALSRLRRTVRPEEIGLDEFRESHFDALLELWKRENSAFNFPLASHFLQEEVWIVRALRALSAKTMIDPGDLPIVAARLLTLYREHARQVVESQPQLPYIKQSLEILLDEGVKIGVASNDRDFATRSMLSWAQLDSYFHWIFTSEGLSTPTQQIEKPQELFFGKIEQMVAASEGSIDSKVYFGDNELNDVEVPMRLGYVTVRYINQTNPADAIWLDHRTSTSAPYKYTDPKELPSLIRTLITDRF